MNHELANVQGYSRVTIDQYAPSETAKVFVVVSYCEVAKKVRRVSDISLARFERHLTVSLAAHLDGSSQPEIDKLVKELDEERTAKLRLLLEHKIKAKCQSTIKKDFPNAI